LRFFSIVVLVTLLWTASADAQTSVHGSLTGQVTDPMAAAVPGAAITLMNVETNAAINATSDAGGGYGFARVPPGRYRLKVEAPAFSIVVRELTISVNEAAVANINLTVGAVTEAVTVEAGPEIVQLQTSSVSLLMDETRVRELPLNSKDFQKLILLAPGVGLKRSANPISNASTYGSRDTSNNYVIDGIGANDETQTAGLAPGRSDSSGIYAPNVISTEAIQEFRIITSNADATFGRGAGAQVNVITKSGTNAVHGSAYEFLRNNVFDARDFFNAGPFFDARGRAKVPPFRQNLFGASLGGPIQKDRHFFFANYEGFRQRLEQTSPVVLPNASFIGLVPGNLGRLFQAYYVGLGIIPTVGNPPGTFQPFSSADRAAASSAGFAAALFDGDVTNGEAGVVSGSRTSTRDFHQDAYLFRTDHHIGQRSTFSARYAGARNRFDSSINGLPGSIVSTPRTFDSAVAQFVYSISPGQLLEVRAGLLRDSTTDENPTLAATLASVGVPLSKGIGFTINGTTAFTTPSFNATPNLEDRESVPQASLIHTWSRGRLNLRSGLDIKRIAIAFANNNFARPVYTYTGLVGRNGLLGATPQQTSSIATTATLTIFGTGAGPARPMRRWRSTQQEYFAQADWRVRRGVTLNLGLRYSIFGVYSNPDDAIANLYATDASGNAIPNASPFAQGRTTNRLAPVTGGTSFYAGDHNNWQPRIGTAWDIGGRSAFVLRGAWGLYHDRIYQFSFSQVVRNSPFATTGSVSDAVFDPSIPVSINPLVQSVFAVDPSTRNPYYHRFNITLERQVGRDVSVSGAYVGSRARKLPGVIEPNFTGAFPQNIRPDPRYTDEMILTNRAESQYDALQLLAQRRLARGLSFTGSYTYGRFRDTASVEAVFGPSTFATVINTGASSAAGFQTGPVLERAARADWGDSDYDVRHVLVVSHVFEIPIGRGRLVLSGASGVVNALLGGWSINGIFSVRSGGAFNVLLGRDINDDGAPLERPAVISDSLRDLHDTGSDPVQFLVPQARASTILGVPSNVVDQSAYIPRNAFHGPSVWTYDTTLMKRVALNEWVRLSIEANFFNVFNHTNLDLPQGNLASALFGRITRTAAGFGPRQMQFGAKLIF
jgi:Carboxypeptidase regulatory-like domain